MYLDQRGKACPFPLIAAKKQIETLIDEPELIVAVDNEIAVQNLQKLAGQKKLKCQANKIAERHFEVHFFLDEHLPETAQSAESDQSAVVPGTTSAPSGTTSAAASAAPLNTATAQPAAPAQPMIQAGTLLLINTDSLGKGDEKLGRILAKGFFFALLQQDELPESIIFYNRGVFLTTEGSESLADFHSLADEGVEILSCGTCLDFYGVTDKLRVGGITNLYEIAEKALRAKKLIQP